MGKAKGPLGLLVTLGALIFWAGLAVAQQAEEAPPPFEERLAAWEQILSEAEADLAAPELSQEDATRIRAALTELRGQAQAAADETKTKIDPVRTRLAALGPPPAEGEPAEAEEIAEQRKAIGEEIAALDAQVKQSELLIARANQLEAQISAARQAKIVKQLGQRFPQPLAPDTIKAAIPEAFAIIGRMIAAPEAWWSTLSLEERSDFLLYRTLLLALLAIALGFLLRHLLLRWLARDPAEESPSYTRRLIAAIGKGVADGAIPALILGMFLYRGAQEDTLLSGLLLDMTQGLWVALIMLVLALALPRAVLAPDLPAWRLLPVLPDNARQISRRIKLLATVFAVDLFLIVSTASLPTSLELDSLIGLVLTGLEAVVALTLLPASLWQYASDAGEDRPEEEEEDIPKSRRQAWTISRRLAGLIALAAIVTSLMGYTQLGNYLINNLIGTGGLIGGLFLLRGLGRELIAMALRAAPVRQNLELNHRTRNVLKFWFRFALDILALGFGISIALLIWGVPADQLWSGLKALFLGFKIGNVTISPQDIATAILVFLVIMAVTRMLQRTLNEKVFPRTRFDMGVRNSLNMAIGYVGLAIAVMVGIGALGLDLSNLAIIAGALSVGIGFGLQAIVNNFVSGLILLIERPVKVGDWVIIGNHEGTVKRISVRATEIETFDRQAVIIPNSELISQAVGNWTHKNRLCRVIIEVGVAYGSDTEKVREVLLACAADYPHALKQPAPYVVFRNFGASSLDFQLRCYLTDVDYFLSSSSDLRFAIDKAFREQGIEIPFPQRDLHIRSAEGLGGVRLPAPEPAAEPTARKPAPSKSERDMPDGED